MAAVLTAWVAAPFIAMALLPIALAVVRFSVMAEPAPGLAPQSPVTKPASQAYLADRDGEGSLRRAGSRQDGADGKTQAGNNPEECEC